MRKLFLYLILLILLCFLIPVFCTKVFEITSITPIENIINQNIITENVITENIVSTENTYDYNEYNTIKLLHTATNEIEEIPIDTYLYSVVSAEMPASFELEALKTQAVAARTYTFYKIKNNDNKHKDAHICDNSTCCQAWISKENRMARWEESEREINWNKIVQAVDNTKGKIITYDGQPINAFFHANSGGITEIPINVWGGSGYPYLHVVETSGEDAYTQYASSLEFTYNELVEKIKETHTEIQIDFSSENSIQILEYTDSGRVKTIKIGNVNLSGVEARTMLGLKSTNFTVTIQNEKVIFDVKGYGHGVGMSQTGADSLAKQGKNYEEIILHFYKDVKINNY